MSAEPGRRRGRHDADVVSLVFGVLFTAAAAFYGLLDQGGTASDGVGRWYLPILLILVGVLGLLASLRRRPAAEISQPNPSDAVSGPWGPAP